MNDPVSSSLFTNGMSQQGGFRDIDPSQLSVHAGDARLVDVREPHEFVGELGHIEGAELVPLATISLAARDWSRGQEIVVVCRSGARSAQASRSLAAMGFTRVMNLRGGMIAWNQEKLPVAQ